MQTLSLRIRYRPLKIGWCVRDDNKDDFRRVLRFTHTLWGGRHNPLIPVDDFAFAKQLVNTFRVDALYPAAKATIIQDFIQKFLYLPWPLFNEELFIDEPLGRITTLLDVQHPARRIYDEYIKYHTMPPVSFDFFEWDIDDPLSDVFLVTFGSYPSKEEIGLDYRTLAEGYLVGHRFCLKANQPLPENIYKVFSPCELSTYNLYYDRTPGWQNPGFYVGDASDFTDIVNFWNLRASNIDLLFYDPTHAKRLDPSRDACLRELQNQPPDPRELSDRIAIWSKSRDINADLSVFGTKIIRCTVSSATWNGLNVKPPVTHFEEQSVLGSVADDGETPSITFQLPEKPFYHETDFSTQHLVLSICPVVDILKYQGRTFRIPFIPELNEYFGRECHFIWNEARAEAEGLGIIINVAQTDLTLRALENQRLIAKVFEAFGMKAEPSQPGLISSQLIKQMGGSQGCRVFKISGVRKLIEKYNPYQSFTRSAAVQIIRQIDPDTGRPHFSQYESLYVEKRRGGKLKPEDAFIYLVKMGVFRVGLKFDCPNCQLEFWLSLDDVKTLAQCEYCGNEFNVTPQLRDRDWAYRRSGLFGREDHHEGGIPVALTLQQLDTILHIPLMIYTTAMNIKPVTAPIDECETDLVVLTQGYGGRVQLVIGECKTHKEITVQDVQNLKKVADALPRERIEVFILFSKLAPFTVEEIERCRIAQDPHQYRVILLSDRELEPYSVYERTAKEYGINKIAISLDDLARNTHLVYFDPRQRVK